MFCRYCGSEIDDKAVICVHCGLPTPNMPGELKPTQPVEAQQPAQPPKKANLLGIFGFALSVFSVLVLFSAMAGSESFPFDAIILSIGAIVLSILGMARAKADKSGRGLALAGLIISGVQLVFWIILFIIGLYAYMSFAGFLWFLAFLFSA